MTKRMFIAAGLIAVLIGGSAVAIAQPPQQGSGLAGPGHGPRGAGPRGPGGPAGDLGLRGIELTEAQRDQIRTITESHQAEVQKANQALRDAHRSLAESTQADPLDEATVRSAASSVANALASEAMLRAKIRGEVFAILTAEQQEQAKTRARRR